MSSRLLAPLFGWNDVNPLHWLGSAATEAVGQTLTAAMVAAWSSGLWILKLAFKVIDAFTTPDLSAAGPMGAVYPYTFGIGLSVALVMAFFQVGVAAFKRDGQSIARVLVGLAQFGAVWLGYVGVAGALVTAASGLTHGLLEGLLGIHGFSGFNPGAGWPRQITDTTTATVLGICSWLLIWPAAIAYLLIMLVREAALLLLVATSPIAAGGLMAELGRTWFWRSLRWFLAALLVAPLAALVLGVGERISEGITAGAGHDTTAAVGMAVVSSLLILIGAICPLVLFRLLAFVEPGTSSGAAMRTSLAAHGGISGLLSRGDTAGPAATQDDGAGRSSGEATADTATSSRFAAAGGLLAGVARMAAGSVAVGSDILSTSGVGHSHPYYPSYASTATPSRHRTGGTAASQDSDRPEPYDEGSQGPDEAPPGSLGPPPALPPGPVPVPVPSGGRGLGAGSAGAGDAGGAAAAGSSAGAGSARGAAGAAGAAAAL
ncbi:hypothetical protein [Nocardioides terrisoli]|uniref:hypothetical protein n=1 Tax=Nocardioides terrisoli TaxID=3388267 RepID=UPI00287BC753|nr:hypothetical protein [Nocardioides marmorisolisilvae]